MMFYVLIATSGVPAFLEHQVRLLRHFSAEPLQILVVNDAKEFADPSNWGDANAVGGIADVCARMQLEMLRFPQQQHSRRIRPPRVSLPSTRTAEAIQLGFDSLLERPDCEKLAIIDSDKFPFRNFSFADMLANDAMAIILQTRHHRWFKRISVRYPWNGFLLMNIRRLPQPKTIDFGAGLVNGIRTDTGGKMHRYLSAHPSLPIRELRHLASGTWHPDDVPELHLPQHLADFVRNDPANTGKMAFSEIYEDRFLHFRSGGNWQTVLGSSDGAHRRRFDLFIETLGQAAHTGANG